MATLDPNISDTFEILSAFFANLFYNDLYQKAIISHNAETKSQYKSVTDTYKSILVLYFNYVNREGAKWFNNFIAHIKIEYDKYTKYVFISNSDCIDNICKAFIPIDFLETVPVTQRHNIVYNCVKNVVSCMISDIVKQHLRLIIDERKNKSNVEYIKDKFFDSFQTEREKMFDKFLDSHVKESRTTVSLETAKRLKQSIGELTAENNSLKHKISLLSNKFGNNERLVEELKSKIEALSERNRKLQSHNNEINKQFKDIQFDYDLAKSEIDKLRNARQQSPPPPSPPPSPPSSPIQRFRPVETYKQPVPQPREVSPQKSLHDEFKFFGKKQQTITEPKHLFEEEPVKDSEWLQPSVVEESNKFDFQPDNKSSESDPEIDSFFGKDDEETKPETVEDKKPVSPVDSVRDFFGDESDQD